MYIQDPEVLGFFISDMRSSGFQTLDRLKPSKIVFGRAGSLRLGLDTSLGLGQK